MIDDSDYISRSSKKRSSTATQKIGESIAALARADQKRLGLPDEVLAALADWKNFPSREAKRRQMQYIGRLMRDVDIDAVQDRLETILAPSRAETASLHTIEKTRDALVEAQGEALQALANALAEQHPSLKPAHIRHLAETAASERVANKPPKAYRELFKTLKRAMPDL